MVSNLETELKDNWNRFLDNSLPSSIYDLDEKKYPSQYTDIVHGMCKLRKEYLDRINKGKKHFSKLDVTDPSNLALIFKATKEIYEIFLQLSATYYNIITNFSEKNEQKALVTRHRMLIEHVLAKGVRDKALGRHFELIKHIDPNSFMFNNKRLETTITVGNKTIHAKMLFKIDLEKDTLHTDFLVSGTIRKTSYLNYMQEFIRSFSTSENQNTAIIYSTYLNNHNALKSKLHEFCLSVLAELTKKYSTLVTMQEVTINYNVLPSKQFLEKIQTGGGAFSSQSTNLVKNIDLELGEDIIMRFITYLEKGELTENSYMGTFFEKKAAHELVHAFEMPGKIYYNKSLIVNIYLQQNFNVSMLTNRHLLFGQALLIIMEEGIASLKHQLEISYERDLGLLFSELISHYHEEYVGVDWRAFVNDYNAVVGNPSKLTDSEPDLKLVYGLGTVYLFILMIELYNGGYYTISRIERKNGEPNLVPIERQEIQDVITNSIKGIEYTFRWNDVAGKGLFANYVNLIRNMSPSLFYKTLIDKTDSKYFSNYLSPKILLLTAYNKL